MDEAAGFIPAENGPPEQKGFDRGDYFVPWHVPFHRADAVSALRSGPAGGAIDRDKGSVVYKRFYHLFEEGELKDLVNDIPYLRVQTTFYDKSNWCCIFRKQRQQETD